MPISVDDDGEGGFSAAGVRALAAGTPALQRLELSECRHVLPRAFVVAATGRGSSSDDSDGNDEGEAAVAVPTPSGAVPTSALLSWPLLRHMHVADCPLRLRHLHALLDGGGGGGLGGRLLSFSAEHGTQLRGVGVLRALAVRSPYLRELFLGCAVLGPERDDGAVGMEATVNEALQNLLHACPDLHTLSFAGGMSHVRCRGNRVALSLPVHACVLTDCV